MYVRNIHALFERDFANPDIYLDYLKEVKHVKPVVYSVFLIFGFDWRAMLMSKYRLFPDIEHQTRETNRQHILLERLQWEYETLKQVVHKFNEDNKDTSIQMKWILRDKAKSFRHVTSSFSYRFRPGSLMGAVCYVLRDGSSFLNGFPRF